MKNGCSREIKNESGMMVVEATLSFTIFILAIVAIIYLTNIFMVHNKVQFALNSAAHEIASYSYIYQAFGIRNANKAIKDDGSKYVDNIDSTAEQVVDTINKIGELQSETSNMEIETISVNDVQNIWNDAKSTVDSGKASYNKIKELVTNPKDLLIGVIYMAADMADVKLKSIFAQYAAMGLAEKYLTNGNQTADTYLKSMGVVDGYSGLDFSKSSAFCDSDMKLIDLVVEYDLDLSFLKLILPDTKLHIVQRATVSGWLNGDGEFNTLESYGVETQW